MSFRNSLGLRLNERNSYLRQLGSSGGGGVPRTESLMTSRLRLLGNGGGSILGDSDGTVTDTNCILKMWNESGATVTKLRVYYINWRASNNGEVNGANAITIEGSIEYPIGTFNRVTFSAANSRVLAIGETVESDEITLITPIPPNAELYARTYLSGLSASQKYPMGYVVDTTSSEACDFNTGVNKVMSGTITDASTTARRGYAPVAIKATAFTGTLKSMAIIGWGDSIMSGNNPAANQNCNLNTGYLGRGLNGVAPFVNWGFFSATAVNNVSTITKRLALAQMIGATHIYCNYGRNDLTSGRTLAQMQADLASIWSQMATTGLKIIEGTVTTRITSIAPYDGAVSRGYSVTYGHNANPSPANAETIRKQFNAWVMTKPSPLYKVYDAATTLESGFETGKMKASDSGSSRLSAYRECADTGGSSVTVLNTDTPAFSPSNWLSTGEGFAQVLTGANAGQVREVASTTQTGNITLSVALPNAPTSGDTYRLVSINGAATADGVHPSNGTADTSGGQILMADFVRTAAPSWQ